MRFNDCICCDEKHLRVQMDSNNIKLLGNSEQIVMPNKAELFVILRNGLTKRGMYKNFDTEHDLLFLENENEINVKQIIFVGIL